MSRRGGLLTKSLFFVVLLAGTGWIETGDAFEPGEGRPTTGLNVRQSPVFGSRIIAWLQKGEKVEIIDEKEKWYKIVFEVEGKTRQEGWVHGKYIQRSVREKEDVASAPEKVRSQIVIEELQEKIPAEISSNEGRLSENGIKEGLRETSAAATTQVAEEKPLMVSQEALLRSEAGMTNTLPEKGHELLKETSAEVFQTDSPAPEKEGSKPPFTPEKVPVISKGNDTTADTIVPVGKNAITTSPTVLTDENERYDVWGFNDFIKLSVRLLSAAFSCLAVLLSYKAIKLAKISYNAAMQFQHNPQVGRQRGDARTG